MYSFREMVFILTAFSAVSGILGYLIGSALTPKRSESFDRGEGAGEPVMVLDSEGHWVSSRGWEDKDAPRR